MGVLGDVALEERLAALHARSAAQEAESGKFFAPLFADGRRPGPEHAAAIKAHLADKMVALEPDKAEFCHLLIRATGARRVVEIGTSYGVSTLYLASAVRDNLAANGGTGGVVGTEYEPGKAAAARALFAETGLSPFIDLREGDLRETLRDLEGPLDFVLMDIWLEAVVPAMTLVGPLMRPGAVIVADNTVQARDGYGPFFEIIAEQGFRSLTLPFSGGLELAVKVG